MIGVAVPNLSGGYSGDDAEPTVHHQAGAGSAKSRPTVSSTSFRRRPASLSRRNGRPHVADTKDLIGDWRSPLKCGAFNVQTKTLQPPGRRPDLSRGIEPGIPGAFRLCERRAGGCFLPAGSLLAISGARHERESMTRCLALSAFARRFMARTQDGSRRGRVPSRRRKLTRRWPQTISMRSASA